MDQNLTKIGNTKKILATFEPISEPFFPFLLILCNNSDLDFSSYLIPCKLLLLKLQKPSKRLPGLFCLNLGFFWVIRPSKVSKRRHEVVGRPNVNIWIKSNKWWIEQEPFCRIDNWLNKESIQANEAPFRTCNLLLWLLKPRFQILWFPIRHEKGSPIKKLIFHFLDIEFWVNIDDSVRRFPSSIWPHLSVFYGILEHNYFENETGRQYFFNVFEFRGVKYRARAA